MSLTDALDRYFAAWNDHDPDAVVRSLSDGGSYEDPTTGGPLTGDALAANVATLLAGFPDLQFDLVSVAPTSDTTAAAQWLMRGTNTGPMPAGPATGQAVALPGADFIDDDAAADRVAKVTGYFDSATMLRQLGLQAHITPADMEPVTKFGISLRVDAQRQAVPGAFSVTWIDIDPEHQFTLFEATTGVVMEQLGNDGYLGSCFATIGRRNYTFTASLVLTCRFASPVIVIGNRRRAAVRELAARGPGPQRGPGERYALRGRPGGAAGTRAARQHAEPAQHRPGAVRGLRGLAAGQRPAVGVHPADRGQHPGDRRVQRAGGPRGHAHQHDQAGLESPRPGGPQWHPLGQMPPQRRRIGPQPGPACGEHQLAALFAQQACGLG